MTRSAFHVFPNMTGLLQASSVLPKNIVLRSGNVRGDEKLPIPADTPDWNPSVAMTFLPLQPYDDSGAGVVGRLIYWPAGLPPQPWAAVVSSRLGRKLEERSAWFRALRAVSARMAQEDQPILNIPGTTSARFLPRATELFATPRIDVCFPSLKGWNEQACASPQELRNWWDWAKQSENEGQHTGRLFLARLSPQVALQESPLPVPPIDSGALGADFLALRMANSIYALHVREGGRIEALLRCALSQHDEVARPSIHLAIGANVNGRSVPQSMLERGAIGWYLYPAPGSEVDGTTDNPIRLPSWDRNDPRMVNVSQQGKTESHEWKSDEWDSEGNSSPGRILTHCTRRCRGPWPNQSSKAYLDDLILERTGADHSPLAALQRIIASQRLIASPLAIRGGVSVVSFTSVSLSELQELRVFRAHRGRWDFEPYGICIRRSALLALESDSGDQRLQPVVYATDVEWSELDESQRPFFQKSHSSTKSGRAIDWTAEQEWRCLGDVDLTLIGVEDAYVFVPTREAAIEIARISPWRVRVLGGDRQEPADRC